MLDHNCFVYSFFEADHKDGNSINALNEFEALLSDFYNSTNCGDIESRFASTSMSATRVSISPNETHIHTTRTSVDGFTAEGVTLTVTEYDDGHNKTLALDIDGNTVVVEGSNDVDQAWTIFKNKDEEECALKN